MSISSNKALRRLFVPGAGLVMPGAGYALTAPGIEATGHKVMLVSRRRWIWLAVL